MVVHQGQRDDALRVFEIQLRDACKPASETPVYAGKQTSSNAEC